jgi:hypothetical protein
LALVVPLGFLSSNSSIGIGDGAEGEGGGAGSCVGGGINDDDNTDTLLDDELDADTVAGCE